MLITILFGLLIFLLFCFSFVLLFGAPFLPTLNQQIDEALNLLNLQPGQTMLELGCGDGRVLIAASKRNIKTIGYELNPVLVCVAKLRTWQHRRNVKIVWGNFWHITWPKADGIFVFSVQNQMSKLNNKITHYSYRPVRVASFAFTIPDKKVLRSKNGVFLYNYDLPIDKNLHS